MCLYKKSSAALFKITTCNTFSTKLNFPYQKYFSAFTQIKYIPGDPVGMFFYGGAVKYESKFFFGGEGSNESLNVVWNCGQLKAVKAMKEIGSFLILKIFLGIIVKSYVVTML